MRDEIKEFLARHGCFCGGKGSYCVVSHNVTCTHCNGTGKKLCACEEPSFGCGHPPFASFLVIDEEE